MAGKNLVTWCVKVPHCRFMTLAVSHETYLCWIKAKIRMWQPSLKIVGWQTLVDNDTTTFTPPRKLNLGNCNSPMKCALHDAVPLIAKQFINSSEMLIKTFDQKGGQVSQPYSSNFRTMLLKAPSWAETVSSIDRSQKFHHTQHSKAEEGFPMRSCVWRADSEC